MKKIVLIILLLIFVYRIQAQNAVATHEQIDAFFKTTTCIVFDDNIFNTYNNKIKAAVEQNWKITPYKFITMDEYHKLKHDPNYSFLIRTKVTFDKDKDHTPYTFLSLLLGEKTGRMDRMPDLCSFPLSYYNVDYDKYDYKLGAFVLFIQNHVKLTYDNPDLNEKNIIKYYNKNVESLKGKTLYFVKDELAPEVNTYEKIKKIYDGDFKIVTRDQIKQLIQDADPNAVFLHKVGPPKGHRKARCYKMLMGAADGKLYYTDYHKIKGKKVDGFLKSDFKRIRKMN